jgi:hypothetical protein
VRGRETETTLPDGTKIYADGRKELADGTVIHPDGRIELPDGTIIEADRTIKWNDRALLPDGSMMMLPGGAILPAEGNLPPGVRIEEDGRVVLADGTVVMPDGMVILPDGTKIAPGGTVAEGKFDPDGRPRRPEAGRPGSVGTENCPIIVVPGVMGSRLFEQQAYNQENVIWPPELLTLMNNFIQYENKMRGSLYLRPHENQQTAVVREYGALSTFQEIVEKLCAEFPDREVYLFSYDWRKSCAENSEKLAEFIDWLNVEKVDLVCHSMGGIVASAYYADNINTHKINRVITCGTPYEGSPKIVNAMVNWDVLKSVGTVEEASKDLILGLAGLRKDVKTSYASSAELVPSKNYVSVIPMRQIVVYGEPMAPVDIRQITYSEYLHCLAEIYAKDQVEGALAFQDSLRGAGGYNALLGYENAYFSIGVNQKTPGAVVFDTGGGDVTDMVYEKTGDGTVPYLSGAVMREVENLEPRRWRRFPTDHSGTIGHHNEDLPSVDPGADASLAWVVDILRGGDSAAGNEPLNGDPYIVARVACPVEVTVEQGGELLSSDGEDLSLTASFGRLDIIGADDEIKMLCLDEGDYAVTLDGTDTGTMDYTLRRFDGEDNLTDERHFAGVPVTADTLIYTDTDPEATVLRVDADGDGDIDSTWTARANETRRVADGQQDPDTQNPDPQNPDPQNPDPQNPDPQNPDPQNPDPQNPDPQNPDPQNPDPQNPDPQNPDPQNPDPQNPDPQNPDPQNPDTQQPVTPPGRTTSRSVGAGSPAASDRISYIGGANRILTAVAVSRFGWAAADTVILTSGADENLMDALAAAPLAGQEDAPILLCRGDRLDPAVTAELRRLQPKKIYVIGAVSQAIIDELARESAERSLEVLKGANRFETAALVSAQIENPQGTFIVGYNAVADAVSAAPYAAAHGYLIQITNSDGTLATDHYPLSTDHYILGGSALVRDIPGAARIYGPNRFATNQALRETLSFNDETVYIADGDTLVDALTGAALAAKSASSVILTRNGEFPDPALMRDNVKIYAIGGGDGAK